MDRNHPLVSMAAPTPLDQQLRARRSGWTHRQTDRQGHCMRCSWSVYPMGLGSSGPQHTDRRRDTGCQGAGPQHKDRWRVKAVRPPPNERSPQSASCLRNVGLECFNARLRSADPCETTRGGAPGSAPSALPRRALRLARGPQKAPAAPVRHPAPERPPAKTVLPHLANSNPYHVPDHWV
jgi:hypothetical protein